MIYLFHLLVPHCTVSYLTKPVIGTSTTLYIGWA